MGATNDRTTPALRWSAPRRVRPDWPMGATDDRTTPALRWSAPRCVRPEWSMVATNDRTTPAFRWVAPRCVRPDWRMVAADDRTPRAGECHDGVMTRIALVLGGGGLTGTAFHAGVLTALARYGWDARTADVIIGTSAGSTATALLRAGFPPSDYVGRMTGGPISPEGARVLDRIGRVPTPPKRRAGARRPASTALLRAVARRPWAFPLGVTAAAFLPAGTIDIDEVNPGFGPLFHSWPDRPTWITAVSLDSGKRAVFGRDATATIPEAVSASCAIPGYFRPVMINGVAYVDGGAHSIHNADLVAGGTYDVVVVSAPLSTADALAAEVATVPRGIVRRQLDREVKACRKAGARTLVFAPDSRLRGLMGLNSMDITKRSVVAQAAEVMAARQLSARNDVLPRTG